MRFEYSAVAWMLASATGAVASVAPRAAATLCCSVMLLSNNPILQPILAGLGVSLEGAPVDVGVGCNPVTAPCPNTCGGVLAVCPVLDLTATGIGVGIGCSSVAPPKCSTCTSVSTSTSSLFGGDKGSAFNDFDALVGANPVTTSDLPSIREISLAYGDVIDGFSVTYTQGSGETRTTFSHGTSLNATDSGLRKSTLTLTADENITTVSGRSGATSHGTRVIQVQFTIFNSATNTTRMEGPFGRGSGGDMFTIAGNGVAFGGYANNTDLSLSQLRGQDGGLYGLKFIMAIVTTFPCLSLS